MTGKPGRSGKRKSVATRVLAALKLNDDYMPQYLDALRTMALDLTMPAKDRLTCLVYLINRSQGIPKAQLDVSAKLNISADELQLAISAALHEQDQILSPHYTLIDLPPPDAPISNTNDDTNSMTAMPGEL